MNKEQMIDSIKNYRSMKYALQNGIAPFQSDDMLGMPMGGGYGSRPPASIYGRGSTFDSTMDVISYSIVVRAIEGAVNDVLSDNQRTVINRKYLDRNTTTLFEISKQLDKDESTIRRWHKEALNKLEMCLKFVDYEEIINLDKYFEKPEKCTVYAR